MYKDVCSTRSSSFLIFCSTTYLLLNDPPRMDKDRNEMSRRILDFTLEIIYLLSGEEYTIVKKTSCDCTTPIIHESGGWSSSPITEPPPHSRIHEKKILELIYKMTELLTGEVTLLGNSTVTALEEMGHFCQLTLSPENGKKASSKRTA
ncbi:oocyte zinc finger protein XlCOF29-like isoform X2 [Rhinoderma darwinii]|uniref:oocyte zinc finger protein XlCOF29-like isoform X2 n=1 Tax=Rhinoderma darwinii TaxID=43563 RepID=UPI003F66446B